MLNHATISEILVTSGYDHFGNGIWLAEIAGLLYLSAHAYFTLRKGSNWYSLMFNLCDRQRTRYASLRGVYRVARVRRRYAVKRRDSPATLRGYDKT